MMKGNENGHKQNKNKNNNEIVPWQVTGMADRDLPRMVGLALLSAERNGAKAHPMKHILADQQNPTMDVTHHSGPRQYVIQGNVLLLQKLAWVGWLLDMFKSLYTCGLLPVYMLFVFLLLWPHIKENKRLKGNKNGLKRSEKNVNRSHRQKDSTYCRWPGNLPSTVGAEDGWAAATRDISWMVGLTLPSVIEAPKEKRCELVPFDSEPEHTLRSAQHALQFRMAGTSAITHEVRAKE
ncbi:hypothetical protein M9H77_02996 [Catharanthus roseus]|uniref:Uncharacterized protein n=1 Tax=Catharanthus roseus TaxID=4058 RepID=A0ACC0CAF3_CATRO|nr:hypothetical protein M9H77_02996 [Catharanthus roseus]